MKNEIRVGILTIISLLILYLGFNYLKGKNVFSSEKQVIAVYDKVDGLVSGNPIMLNGFNIGIIESTDMMTDGSGRIVVTLSLNDGIPIPKNSIAKIVSAGFMGDKNLEIVLPNKKAALSDIEYGDTLQGLVEVSLVNTVSDELIPVKDQLTVVMASLNETIEKLNLALDKGKVGESLATLNTTLNSFNSIAKKVDGSLGSELEKISGITANIESMTSQIQSSIPTLNSTLNNANTASQKLANLDYDETVDKLNTVLTRAEDAMLNLNNAISQINSGEGTAGKLMKDEELYNNLNQTAADLDKLLVDLRENPKKYVHFSLISRKDKKNKE